MSRWSSEKEMRKRTRGGDVFCENEGAMTTLRQEKIKRDQVSEYVDAEPSRRSLRFATV